MANQVDEGSASASLPSWRTFAFFDDVELNLPSLASLGGTRQVHSIRPLARLPPGVRFPVDGGDAEHERPRTLSHRDYPLLAVFKTGALQLLDPSTLAPITDDFNCLPSADGLVTHVEYDAESERLVVLSEDAAGANAFPLLRIWQLNANVGPLASPKAKWQPRLLTQARIQHGRKPFPIAQVAITPKLSYLACSLANGAVLLLRNVATVLDAAPIPTASNIPSPVVVLPKLKVAYQPSSSSDSQQQEPVTALGFSSTASVSLSLFIATLSRVIKYIVLGKGAGNSPTTLDDIGCSLGCSAILPPQADSEEESKLLLARDEALYVIGSNGREDCLAYEGPKANLTHLPVSNQVVITSPLGTSTKVSILDLRGKFLSYSGTIQGDVLATFSDSLPTAATATTSGREDVLVLTSSSQLHRLQERSLRAKIDVLFRKGLFILASQVAKSHFEVALRSADATDAAARLNSLLADIWIKYGDYLYEKGDYEGSMKMGYLKSVAATAAASGASSSTRRTGRATSARSRSTGRMGESYIIRKFLDAQRIPLLTLYLQELHKRGLANSDHTTLLLNCYTKMKNTEALDRFIRRSHVITGAGGDQAGDDDGGDDDDGEDAYASSDSDSHDHQDHLPFDLPTAIKVCRSANYFSQAAYLAKKFNMGDEYLRIKIEDTHMPSEALEWLRTREASEVVHYMRIYAGSLIASTEEQTTDLLIELCSGAYRPKVVNSPKALEQAAKAAAKAAQSSKGAKGYLDYLPGGGGTQQRQNGTADPPAYEVGDGEDGTGEGNGQEDATTTTAAAPYYIPSARQFFPHFMKFPASFKRFLETVALARWGQAIDDSDGSHDSHDSDEGSDHDDDDDEATTERKEQGAIWDTILEMLLRQGSDDSRQKALRLLRQHRALPYDVHHALILCEEAKHTEGVVYLYERLGMYEDVLRLWMDESRRLLSTDSAASSAASQKVLDSLERYAESDASLYSLVLTFLTSHPTLLSTHRDSITSILTSISSRKLLSTLEIIQLLSSSSTHVNVGLIKTFLEDTVSEEQSEMEADSKLIESYRAESTRKEREMEELTRVEDISDARVFQSTRCTACGGQLDLPAVHFMCKHSYHARCLGEDTTTTTSGEAGASTTTTTNECPTCLRSYGVVAEIRRNNQAMARRHDIFLQEIEEAEDPFQAVASMFGRGVFSRQALE